ncbi:MAG: ABC transporter permease subunit [Herminiimonas sp.]|nr:ABC transporter permease subunit [Herminiimonas sp.]
MLACAGTTLPAQAAETLHVGTKRFTESYILGEVLTRTANAGGSPAEHLQGLGNTAIVFAALKAGSIDLYPEYLGTIDAEILKHSKPASIETINRELAPLGLAVAVPLGFNNTYAMAMKQSTAQQRGIRTLGDLRKQSGMKFGLSHEFIGRADGWPGMAQRYGLAQQPIGLDHGIAYEALDKGQVDVIDIYSTDAKIAQFGLTVLQDDLHYFPPYDAVLLYRLDVATRFPAGWAAIQKLQGRIQAADMIAMNAAVEIGGKSFATVAGDFLKNGTATAPATAPITGAVAPTSRASAASSFADKLFDPSLWRLTRQHLTLVLLSVAAATLIGIPLGVLAAFVPRLEQTVMAVVGVLQTVPSLALLAMLIPLLGQIGFVPALIALFLYALLPIVRNTCTGVSQVPPGLRMAALALGLSRRDRLLYIDLPLAMPVILAGLKTAAVMSVGTATIAAFIGAGGYGERIAIGLALNDNAMLLAGAIPAAVLALLTQVLFELIERRFRIKTIRD